jgi:hypothetical protein
MPFKSTRDSTRRSQPRSATLLVGVVVLATLYWLAVPAEGAVAGGVHFDPESPAGKEYALPLAQARNEAMGGGGSDDGSGASAPLFGAGISGRGRTIVRSGNGASQRASDGSKRANGATKGSERQEATKATAADIRLADAGGGYPVTDGVGMVAVIVLLGGGLGLALRALLRVKSD